MSIVGFLALSANGVQPNRIVIDLSEDFAQGEAESVILEQPGLLKPGPRVDLLHEFDNTLLWDAVEMPQSRDLIIGTGPEGKVFRLNSKGKAKELTAFAESDVYAVAVSPDGDVFVASSPDGKVFKMNRKGEFDVWFEHGEKYVWDMLFDDKGRLYLATGQTGKLFRVDSKRQGKVIFDADEPHLRSLVKISKDQLIIGTTGSGLIYHYQTGKEPVVLLDSSRSDISAVAVSDTGIIYAAAVGKKQNSSAQTNTTVAAGEQMLAAVRGLITTNGSDEKQTTPTNGKVITQKQAISKGSTAVCEIYRIDRQLYPQVIYQSPDEIHSLVWGNGSLLAGAGEGGRFFSIKDSGEAALLGKIESKQITALLSDSNKGFILLGSNWGKVARLNVSQSEAGVYTSKVIDSGLFADWCSLKVQGQGKWSIRSRSGNTKNPDKSWYPWQFLKGEKPMSPQARYFQFEVRIETGYVERVDFTFLPQNQAPVVKVVRALEPNQGFISIKQVAPPAKIQTGSQLLKPQAAMPLAVTRYRPVKEAGLRTIVWEAADANGDRLLYDLYIQREGEDWEILADGIEDTVFSWDTRGWPDGVYYARVEASDHIDNGAGKELTGDKTSEGWRIDHASPEIRLVTQTAEAVTVLVTDRGGVLEAVAVSDDGQSYRVSIPEDGILDSANEEFTFDRDPKVPIYIRAKDENGNVSGYHIPAER
ncbi:MAG: WD40 repeat domain-containing protein [Verrucomicrobiota bacterium]